MTHSVTQDVIVSLVVVGASTALASEPGGLVAVLPITPVAGSTALPALDTLTESIRAETGNALSPLGFTVLTGENTLKILTDNGIDTAKACESSCALELAKELKARLFVSGTVSNAEGDLVAFVRVFDGSNGRQLGSLELEGATPKDLRRAFGAKAGGFYAAVIVQLRAAGEVTQAPVDATATLEILTPLDTEHFRLQLATSSGIRTCAQELSFLTPCRFQLVPGPAQLRVEGGGTLNHAFSALPDGVTRATLDRDEWSGLEITGLVLTSIGGAVALFGSELVLLTKGFDTTILTPMWSASGASLLAGLLMMGLGSGSLGVHITELPASK